MRNKSKAECKNVNQGRRGRGQARNQAQQQVQGKNSVDERNNSRHDDNRSNTGKGNTHQYFDNTNDCTNEFYDDYNNRSGWQKQGNNRFDQDHGSKRRGNHQARHTNSRNNNNNNFDNHSQHKFQGFAKFADSNSDRGQIRVWEENRNFNEKFDFNKEYSSYRKDYNNSRTFNEPLLNYSEFEEKCYNNRDNNQNTAKFQKTEERNVQNINYSNNNESTPLPAPSPAPLSAPLPVPLPPPKINIKQEKVEEVQQQKQSKSNKTDSSNTSTSSSNGETLREIKKLINSTVTGEKPLEKTNNSLKNTDVKLPKPKIKKEISSSKDSSPSDDSSTTESEKTSKKKVKPNITKLKKSKVEEEVICLGKLEKYENLVEDEKSSSEKSEPECILCDEDGHTSFFCKMICRNCGDKYHNCTMCLKPPNLSRMLQLYMEFTMSQCCQYDPEKRFIYRNGNAQTELLPGFAPPIISNSAKSVTSEFNAYSNEFLTNNEHKKRKRSSVILSKRKSKKARDSSELSSSSSSSTETTSTKKRKKLVRKNVQDVNTNQNLMSMQFNPLMMAALGQMMGLNPNPQQQLNNFPLKKER